MLNIDLTGKNALVIGGSRGIGAAITRFLCAAGAGVTFTHTGNPKYAQDLGVFLEHLKQLDGMARAEALDARDSEATTSLVDRIVGEQGKLDVLVANVGQNVERNAAEVTDGQWKEGVEINLSAAFYGVRAALPHMKKAGYGRIILIGSSATYNGGGGAIEYAAAKAGVNGMMLYLAKTHARHGILTNVIHPAVIETDLLRERYGDDSKKKQLIAQIPVGRLGKPEDIAGLAVYLASEWGDFVCGQSILVDGGRTLFS